MIIRIDELQEREEPLQVELKLDEDAFGVDADARLSEPAQAWLTVWTEGERFLAEGSIRARLLIVCSRCLKEYQEVFEQYFRSEYWPDPEVESEEEIELEYEDLDVGFYRETVDLTAVAAEPIVLEIPMKPLCSEACKGLCDQCGADLNLKQCGCERVLVDPRLEPLKAIKKRMEE